MGRAARPLHDPGNHRSIERGSNLQAARRGGLIKPAKAAGERVNTAALTPSLGTRAGRPASKKRQGTKSREVGAPSVPRALWGFNRGVRLGEVGQSARPNCFASQDGCG